MQNFLTFILAKHISILDHVRIRRLNEPLTNDFVNLTMLWGVFLHIALLTDWHHSFSIGQQLGQWLAAVILLPVREAIMLTF